MKRLAKPLFSSLGDLRDTQVMLEWVAKLAEPGDPVAESLIGGADAEGGGAEDGGAEVAGRL